MLVHDLSPEHFGLVPIVDADKYTIDEERIRGETEADPRFEDLQPSDVIVDFIKHRHSVSSQVRMGRFVLAEHGTLTASVFSIMLLPRVFRADASSMRVTSIIVPREEELRRIGEWHNYSHAHERPKPYTDQDYRILARLHFLACKIQALR